jgi:hypothetical protein
VRGTFERALHLAGDCYQAYVLATPEVRRMFDQVFFERIHVSDDDGAWVSGAILSPEYALLLADDLLEDLKPAGAAAEDALQHLAASWGPSEPQPTSLFLGQGSKELKLAEREGFEPSMELAAPYSLSRRVPSATRPPLPSRVSLETA